MTRGYLHPNRSMKDLSVSRRVFAALLVLSAASLLPSLPSALRVASAFLSAYYLPGFVFLLFAGDRERPLLDNIFLPLLVSPVILSVLVVAVHAVTHSLDASIRISLAILYILLVAALVTGRFRSIGKPFTFPAGILPISLLCCSVVVVSYIVNDYLLVYTDAWHHISVANEILDRGIPPLAPFLPDVPLRYMWFYHLFQAVYKKLSGLPVPVVMGLFNAVNALAFPYLIARLVSLFTDRHRYILTAPIFAFAGLESAAWVLWPVKLLSVFFGEVRGTEEIARIIGGIEMNGVNVIYFLTPPWTWLMNLLDKFLTITAFSYSLNLFLLCFILVLGRSFYERSRIKASVCVFTAVVGAFLFHVVTGTALVITAVGAGVLALVLGRLRGKERPDWFQTLVVPSLAVAAAAVAMPYFLSLTKGGAGRNMVLDNLQIGLTNLYTIAVPLIVLVPFSLLALKTILTSDSREFRILASWLAILFLMSIFIDLPGLAENKVVFPLFLLIVPFIAWQIVDRTSKTGGIRRVLLWGWILVLFLVPPVLTVRGFMLERPKEPRYAKRHTITEEERGVFEWIEKNTDPYAVIIERNIYDLMPVHAHRRNFYLSDDYISVHNYGGEKVARYRAVRDEIYSDGPVTAGTIDYLGDTGLDFYVVVWREDLAEKPYLDTKLLSHPEWFQKVYESPVGTVYRIKHRDR